MADVSATEKQVLDTAEQELLASFKEATIADQYTASVHRQVLAALVTIARRRCKHGVHFDNEDMKLFLDIVTKGEFKTMSTHFVEELRNVWSNEIGKSNTVKSSLQEKVLDLIVKFVKHISSIEESYRNTHVHDLS